METSLKSQVQTPNTLNDLLDRVRISNNSLLTDLEENVQYILHLLKHDKFSNDPSSKINDEEDTCSVKYDPIGIVDDLHKTYDTTVSKIKSLSESVSIIKTLLK